MIYAPHRLVLIVQTAILLFKCRKVAKWSGGTWKNCTKDIHNAHLKRSAANELSRKIERKTWPLDHFKPNIPHLVKLLALDISKNRIFTLWTLFLSVYHKKSTEDSINHCNSFLHRSDWYINDPKKKSKNSYFKQKGQRVKRFRQREF